jgi:signal transduction histidine kinase
MQSGSLTVFLLLLFVLLFPPKINAGPADFSVTHYTSENGLPQNSIRGIELDKNGFIWMATEAGLARFDGRHFKLYDTDHYPVLQYNRIGMLAQDTAGVLCFTDELSNSYTFDNDGRMQRLPENAYVGRIAQLKNNHLWVSDNHLSYHVKGKMLWIMTIPELVYEIKSNRWGRMNLKCYYHDNNGAVWCVDTNRNISKIKITGLLPHLNAFIKKLPLGFLEQDNQLYCQAGKGIYQLTDVGNHELKATLVLETDIPDVSLFRNYPKLNLTVIGTLAHGIYFFRRKQFECYKHTNGFGNFYPQVPYGDSGVITNEGLVYPRSSRIDYPFKHQLLKSLIRDSRGHYWMHKPISDNTNHGVLVKLDNQLKELKTWPYDLGSCCMRETPDGHIWICSFHGKSLAYVDNKDTLRRLPALWEDHKPVRTFLPADNETFWVGGLNILAKLNVKTRKVTHYKSLEKYTIETLYLDRNQVLWVGTSGNGFFAIKNNRIIKLPLDKNRGLKDVHSFIEDRNGFIWMSTNKGLFRCKKTDLDHFIAGTATDVYYQCFYRESGFNTNEFNGSCTPSAIVLGNGKFSFPSMDGLVQFYPDSIHEILPVNRIIVDKLLVDGKQKLLTGHTINLDPSFKYIEVQVTSPYFGNPTNQLLEYRLIGLDNKWHSLKEDNTVVFNNLAHGHYNLQFRKRAGFGYNNFVTASIPLSVKPFFYQTWYFLLLLVLVSILIIYLVIRIRYTYLVRRNKDLEREVGQRTLKLKQANALKEKMLMMVGHDLQSPLHFMGYLSETISGALISEQHKKIGQEMKNTAKNIYAFVDEFNLWARVQDEQFNVQKTTFSLNILLNELQLFFKEILLLNHNTLECTTEQEYELHTNRELLKAVLRNLVDNANKHTQNGTIHIHCKRDSDTTCSICVSDTGDGISPQSLIKIKNLIRSTETVADFDSGDRLGYQLIIDFATRLNVHVAIDSEEDNGTTVLISGIVLHHVDYKNEKG